LIIELNVGITWCNVG